MRLFVVEVGVPHLPQSLRTNTTESLLEVDDVVVWVTLVLQMVFNHQPGVLGNMMLPESERQQLGS